MSETATTPFPSDLDLDAELSDDELDAELSDDEDDELDASDEHSVDGTPGKSSKASRAASNRLIRRVAAKAAEVVAAEAATRDVASHLLNCGNELADLTASIMTADRSSTQVLVDLDKISSADMFEAAVIAGELGNARMKRIWSLLASMGLASGSDLPASSSKASIAIAKTVHGLDMGALNKDLEDVVTLLKKA